MHDVDPLVLAVREGAAWWDLVGRLHRLTPEGDGRLWSSNRRPPAPIPDAVTLVPDVSELEVLGRITDSPGASIVDSFATLDLTDQGWRVVGDATWIARAPATVPDGGVEAPFAVVRERLAFETWCRARGGGEGTLPAGLRRSPGVVVLGRAGPAGYTDGVVLHRTQIGGATVLGLWRAFGAWSDLAAAAARRHPAAWLVGYERGPDLGAALGAGFTAVGTARRWSREHASAAPTPSAS